MRGHQAAQRLLQEEWDMCLDVGAGEKHFARAAAGRKVVSLDTNYRYEPDVVGDYLEFPNRPWQAIWCCHVLEHQTNPGLFLMKVFNDLALNGIFAVTVPPAKHAIVGGHVTLWNAGLLIYNLILAGFDCSEARVGTYGYNISVLVRKKPFELPALNKDAGDITRLAEFFPCSFAEGQSGELPNIRW